MCVCRYVCGACKGINCCLRAYVRMCMRVVVWQLISTAGNDNGKDMFTSMHCEHVVVSCLYSQVEDYCSACCLWDTWASTHSYKHIRLHSSILLPYRYVYIFLIWVRCCCSCFGCVYLAHTHNKREVSRVAQFCAPFFAAYVSYVWQRVHLSAGH